MLTRLKVKGFKNLVDVDIRFGPFTCIAGPMPPASRICSMRFASSAPWRIETLGRGLSVRE